MMRISGLLAVAASLAAMFLNSPVYGSGYTYLTLNDPNATNGTFATGVNDSGAVVGHYVVGFANEGFLYKNGQYTTVQVNGGTATATSPRSTTPTPFTGPRSPGSTTRETWSDSTMTAPSPPTVSR
jgi:hypothetical protein